ncbi:PREDICTED: agamous-like MADS-box protein AGL80 [Prunus mume]|uniref:Agamous-like MADS-box protein AGL80 n=1 Tax=Prunus mume TaxID=102107 RepID=A0ABM0NZQ0_PRUMU|nr:PREDICTED: agamous-like MADS-box protein AGL80 [Prunus mume]
MAADHGGEGLGLEEGSFVVHLALGLPESGVGAGMRGISSESRLVLSAETQKNLVIYGQHQANPDVSPCPDGALRTITRFKQMAKMERSRNILNQESFLRQTILKADEKLKKQMNDNQEKEMMIQAIYGSLPADWLQKWSHVDLNDLWLSVEKNIEAIAEMMTSLEKP